MRTLEQVAKQPSGFDSEANYMGEPLASFSDLHVVMTRHRDSDTLTESNWTTALERLGGESDTVVIHRFGHWACGWWEALCVTGESIQSGQDIVNKLDNYPVLDEEHFSQLETEKAERYWQQMTIKERVKLCQQFEVCVFAARHDSFPRDDNGALYDYLITD